MKAAFTDIKAALLKSVCLTFPKDNAELSLQQKDSPGSSWRPLGFFSAKLETAQLKYSAFV